MSRIEVVCIGASWGGLAALSKLVADLPADFPVPLIIVQHRSRHADSLLATLLQDVTTLKVIDTEDKEPLHGGSVYVAPANYHMLVEREYLSLTTDPLVRFSRPSIDVTFTSAADTFRSGTLGVVLTGANDDGSVGLKHIVRLGGRAIVQDPASAESPSMPAAAAKAVPQAEILKLEQIGPRLVSLVSHGTGAKARRAG